MGTRAIKRNFAKKFKSEERDRHPGLKKASVGKIMKTVDTSGIEESLPLEEICIFTVMIKTLQYSVGVLEKFNKFKSITEVLENQSDDDIFNSINLFVYIFKDIKDKSIYLPYIDVLKLSEERVDTIMQSIDSKYDLEYFMGLGDEEAISILKELYIPFLFTSYRYYLDLYLFIEDNRTRLFKRFSPPVSLEALESTYIPMLSVFMTNHEKLQPEDIQSKNKTKCDNLLHRLLNINHSYTSFAIKKISNEINIEINELFNKYIHKDKEAEVISVASNHFYRILEIRLTYMAMFSIPINRDELKLLFRACYYYQVWKKNNMLEAPKDIKDILEFASTFNLKGIIKLDIEKLEEKDKMESIKVLFITGILEIPTIAFILDSAADAIVTKDCVVDIEVFKEGVWEATKELLLFLSDSRSCNKLYRATYSTDINNSKKYLKLLLESSYLENKKEFEKLLKKYSIFKINKKYIAI